MCHGCWRTTDLETEKIFAEERLSEGLIQSGWGVPWDSAISCLLSTPCSLSLLSCSFFPQPFLIRTPSWVLISTVSVFHVGLCTQATSMTIINNMRGKMGHDSCWKMTQGQILAEGLGNILKRSSRAKVDEESVCSDIPYVNPNLFPSFWYVARRTGWLLTQVTNFLILSLSSHLGTMNYSQAVLAGSDCTCGIWSCTQ